MDIIDFRQLLDKQTINVKPFKNIPYYEITYKECKPCKICFTCTEGTFCDKCKDTYKEGSITCTHCKEYFLPTSKPKGKPFCSWECKNDHKKQRPRKEKVSTEEQKAKEIFLKYVESARKRNIVFNIKEDVFLENLYKDCYYCGDPMKTVGFDRVNNTRGYETDNIVPCCTACNMAKHKHTKEDFIQRCKKVAKRH